MKLTTLEMEVLAALFESSRQNGHDFGFIEDARKCVSPRQLGGVVASLAKKQIITVHDKINGVTQFVIEDLEGVAARLGLTVKDER